MNTRQKQKYESVINYLELQLRIKSKKLQKAQTYISEFKTKTIIRNSRQVLRLAANLQKREFKICSLNCYITRQWLYIINLEAELSSMIGRNDVLEHIYHKSLSMIQSDIQQLSSFSYQNQLDSMPFERKEKKLLQTFFELNINQTRLQCMKNKLEEKVGRLQAQNNELVERNLIVQAELQVERQSNRNIQLYSFGKSQSVGSQSEFLYRTQIQKLQDQRKMLLAKTLQNLQRLVEIKNNEKIEFDNKIDEVFFKVEKKNFIIQQMIISCKQSKRLKDKLKQLKQRLNPQLSDQLLFQQHSQLYDSLKQIMNQIHSFQLHLQKLPESYKQIMSQIQRIVFKGPVQFYKTQKCILIHLQSSIKYTYILNEIV